MLQADIEKGSGRMNFIWTDDEGNKILQVRLTKLETDQIRKVLQ